MEEEDEYLRQAIAESLRTAAAEEKKIKSLSFSKKEEVAVVEAPPKEELTVYKKEVIEDGKPVEAKSIFRPRISSDLPAT